VKECGEKLWNFRQAEWQKMDSDCDQFKVVEVRTCTRPSLVVQKSGSLARSLAHRSVALVGERGPASGLPAQQGPVAPLAAVRVVLLLSIRSHEHLSHTRPLWFDSDVSVLWHRFEEDGVVYFVATSIDNPKVRARAKQDLPSLSTCNLSGSLTHTTTRSLGQHTHTHTSGA
jgi:hypothetical protein